MRRFLSVFALLAMTSTAAAWDPTAENQPGRRRYWAATTVTDLELGSQAGGMVGFSEDPVAACMAMNLVAYQDRLVMARAVMLPLLLFARANNARVYVEIGGEDPGFPCELKVLRTCFDARNCTPAQQATVFPPAP